MRRFGLLVALLSALVSTPAAASVLPVPDSELVQQLAEATREPATDDRWQCSPGADPTCRCIEYEVPGGRFFASGVDSSSGGLMARRFLISNQRGWLVGRDLAVWPTDSGLQLEFNGGYWHKGQTAVTIGFDDAAGRETDAGPAIEFSAVRWAVHDTPVQKPSSCPELNDHSPDIADEATRAAARSLRFDGDSWRAAHFEVAEFPGPSTVSDLEPGERLSGWTVPTAYVDADRVQLSGTYHPGGMPWTLRGHLATPATAGAGVGVMTQSPLCVDARCAFDELALDGMIDSDGGVGIEMSGDAAIGDALRHVSLSSDGIGLGGGDSGTSPASRFRRNGGFQQFNTQQFGASYSGDNHNLAAGGTIVTPGDHSFDLLDDRPRAADIWTRYGTVLELAAGAHGTLGMSHREFTSVGEPSGRMTTADLRVDRRFGSLRRMWIRPSMSAGLVAAGIDDAEGLSMSSRPRLDVMIDSGLALQGRLGQVNHRVAPRVYVGRRLEADQQFEPSVHLSELEESHHRPPDSSYFGGAVIEQRLDFNGPHRLRFPVGIAVVGDLSTSLWQPVFQGSLQFDTRIGDRRLQVGADGLCIASCQHLGARGFIRTDWGQRVRSIHLVEWGHHRRAVVPHIDSRIRSRWSNRLRTTPVAGQSPERLTHMTALRGRFQGWSAQWTLRGRPSAIGELDTGLHIVRYWNALGWGIGVQGAASLDGTEWAALIGVRNSPAF